MLGTIRRDASRLVVATGIGYLLAILLAPVLSRLYTPSEFGLYTIFGAVAFCDAVACLGFDRAVGVARDERSAHTLFVIALFSVAVVAVLSAGIAWWAAGFFPSAPLWLWLAVPAYVLSFGTSLALSGLALRNRAIHRVAAARVGQAATVPLSQVLLGMASNSAPSLVAGQIAGQVVSAATYMVKGGGATTARVRIAEVRQLVVEYRHFPSVWVPATLLNSLNLQASLLAVGLLYGAGAAGLYGFGQRIAGAGVGVISSAVSQAYFAHAAAAVRSCTEVDGLRRHATDVLRSQALLAVPLMLVLLAAPLWVELVFGKDWIESGTYFQLLAAPLAAQLCISPLHAIIDVLQRPELHVVREVVRFVLTAVVFGVATIADVGIVATLALYGLGVCLSYALSLGLIRRAINRTAKAAS
ncbi:MAG: hypothetical protein CMLOHMNK_01660 [Steroidobacteraceae bacterium]|nr:hypothetical protein [Steroidobacteraceae bacterium]